MYIPIEPVPPYYPKTLLKKFLRIIFAAIGLLVLFWGLSAYSGEAPSASQTAGAAAPEQKDLDFADGLYQRGMYDAAARQYGDFLKKNPGSPNRELATFRQGESLYQLANQLSKSDPAKSKSILLEARLLFQKQFETNPKGEKKLDAYMRHGEISYKTGDAKTGLKSLLIVVKESKDPVLLEAALFYSARCHDSLEQAAEAEERYRQIRDTYPNGEYAAFSTYLLAELLVKADKTSEAVTLLNDLWQHTEKYKIPKDSTLIEDAQLRSAQVLYQKDQFSEASNAYQAYIKAHPESADSAKAKYGAAWAEYRRKNYAQALAIAKTLQRSSLPADLSAGILFLEGTCAYQQKQYEEAALYFREIIADPNAGEYRERSWYQLCWAYYLTNQFDKARQECKNLLQQSIPPNQSANLHFLLGQSYAQLQQYPDAIAEMKMAVQLHPSGEYAQDAGYLTADLLYRTQQYPAAGNAFEQFALKYPNSPRAKEAWLWAANARYAAKDYTKAVETVDQLLKLQPNLENHSEVLFRKALAHYQLKEYDTALKTFAAVLKDPAGQSQKADSLYWTAYILELQGHRGNAAETYDRLLKQFPNFENRDEVRLRKAICDYQEKKFPEAYKEFQVLLDTPQGGKLDGEVLFWAISYADENKKHEEALQIAERVLKLSDKLPIRERALIAKSNQLVALERWKEAVDNAETFLKTFPESKFKPEIYWSQARGLEGLDRKDEALNFYNQSLQEMQKLENPDAAFEAELYVDRGRLLESLGKTGDALESFLRVAIIYDHPELTPEAMVRSIRCHLKLGEKKEAKLMYNDLMQRYKESSWSRIAQEEFKELE